MEDNGKPQSPGYSSAFLNLDSPVPQRPSVMLLGKPFSQPLGAFQGRTEAFSESSVVAHAVKPSAAITSSKSRAAREFKSRCLMKRDEPELPDRLPSLRPAAIQALHWQRCDPFGRCEP